MDNDTILNLQKQILNLEKRLEQYYHLLLSKIGKTTTAKSLNENTSTTSSINLTSLTQNVNKEPIVDEPLQYETTIAIDSETDLETNSIDEIIVENVNLAKGDDFLDGQICLFPFEEDPSTKLN